MPSRKPTEDSAPDADRARLAEDERKMFERELAGVRPLRRGPERVSAIDFDDVSASQSRQPQAKPAGGRPPAVHVERRTDGVIGTAFGVSNATVAALARGELGFDARCDLHKLRAQAAQHKLHAFIQECVRRNLRAGLVICGRGLHSGPEGPILVEIVTDVLGKPPTSQHILAFTPTAQSQGGPGAIAVLFRRR
jgi:DNA-nicking Smr family endonuclease